MNFEETARVLAKIQTIDSRRVDEVVLIEWQDILADTDVSAALEAVRMHRVESTEWLVPAHILRNVQRIDAARVTQLDEWGNELPCDDVAAAALARLGGERKAVTS